MTKILLLIALFYAALIYTWKLIGAYVSYLRLLNNNANTIDSMKAAYPSFAPKRYKFLLGYAVFEHSLIFWGIISSIILVFTHL